MDQLPERSDQGEAMIDDWVQTALSDALIRIADNDRLDIHEVDRVGRALEQVRSARQLPDRVHKWPFQYAGLLTLHCVTYREMNPATLAGLPDALLAAFELNDKSGPLFLGRERWPEVRSRYQGQKFAQAARIPIAPMPAQQGAAAPQDTPITTLSRLAQLPVNTGGALQTIGTLLREALEWARATWARLARIWDRQLDPVPSELLFPARSSPSHPPCHYARKEIPAGASVPGVAVPHAAPDPPDVSVQRVHAADAPADDTTHARERRRVPRSDHRFPWDSKSQNE